MFALDLFNNDHERRLAEGAVDQLEQRRIDDLAMKMDSLVARAKTATTPEVKAALVKEFQKCKAERDSYFKIKDECMGYGSLVGEENVNEGSYKNMLWKLAERMDRAQFIDHCVSELGGDADEMAEFWDAINGPLVEAGIGHDIVNKTEKMTRATPSTPAGKVASTVKNAAKWLAGRGGPGREGPTYEGKDDAWQEETPWKQIPKAKSGRPVDPRGEVTHLSDVARRAAELKAQGQKKNPKEVDEAGGGWGLDPKTRLELKRRKERQKTIAKWAGRPVPPQEPKEKEINEAQQLHQGDPIVVTGPNEFEGKTGEIYNFSPSGTFVIVDLYNHGKHSMHLSDVKYNDYADQEEADDWYDDANINDIDDGPQHAYNSDERTRSDQFEGFQDFNKVEPYAVCLAGKPVKKFDYYEEARRFHDNWKKKLYREGDQAKADKITLMPLNLDEEGKGTPIPAKDFVKGVLKDLKNVNVKEAETDYSKRRHRERDVDAGKPVAKQRQSKMTDYQKRRAQHRKDMALGEDQDTSGVESAIIRRIMIAHTDLLKQFGPEKVMQAAEEVAYNVGDVDEIGTSDVSAYVHQVRQILGVPEEVNEKWSQKYKNSINCANPKGFSQKAHCAGRKK